MRLVDGDVIARNIISTEVILVASPAYLQRRGSPQVPADLARHDFLRMKTPGAPTRMLHLFQTARPELQVDLELDTLIWANHPDTLLRAATDGAGVTATTVGLVASQLASGTLVRVLSPWITGQLTVYAALPSRQFLPQRTRVFLEYLSEQTRLLVSSALQTYGGDR